MDPKLLHPKVRRTLDEFNSILDSPDIATAIDKKIADKLKSTELSLRDHFALAVLSANPISSKSANLDTITAEYWNIADSMLRTRGT